MADDDAPNGADETPNNVHSLMGRVGFNPPSDGPESASSTPDETPTLTIPTGADPPGDDLADGEDDGPFAVLAGLPEPGLSLPDSYPIASPPGYVPDTFRGPATGETNNAPRLGALSAAAILAVSVAALRGIHSAVTAWRANREHRRAVDKAAGTAGGKRKGRKDVPSSLDYGRKSLGRRSLGSTSGGGRGGGSGLGRKGRGSHNSGHSHGGHRSGGKSLLGRNRKSPTSFNSSRSRGSTGHGLTSASGRNRKDRKSPSSKRSALSRLLGRGASQRGSTIGRGKGSSKSKGKNDADAFDKAGKKNRVKAPRGLTGAKGALRSKKKSSSSSSSGKGRTTLPRAMKGQMHKAAKRRWKQRKKNLDTPFLWSSKVKDPADASKTKAGSGGKSTKSKAKSPGGASTVGAAKTSGKKKGSKGKRTSPGGSWEHVSARARKRWDRRRSEWPDSGRAFGAGRGGSSRTTDDPFDDGGDHWVFGFPGSGKADPGSPFAAAAAASHPWQFHGTERMNEPRDRPSTDDKGEKEPAAVGRGQPALDAAPTPHTQRPGTSAPIHVGAPAHTDKEKESPMAKAASGPGRAVAYAKAVSSAAGPPDMAPEHETEITLPEALELLEKLTQDGFAAHDQCVRLSRKARELRHEFEDLANDLKTRHNIIGRLTSAAMEMFAEAMEVVARKADEMQVTSLLAAELSEIAEHAMFDAYQPIQQETEDQGLPAPSAYVHNRE